MIDMFSNELLKKQNGCLTKAVLHSKFDALIDALIFHLWLDLYTPAVDVLGPPPSGMGRAAVLGRAGHVWYFITLVGGGKTIQVISWMNILRETFTGYNNWICNRKKRYRYHLILKIWEYWEELQIFRDRIKTYMLYTMVFFNSTGFQLMFMQSRISCKISVRTQTSSKIMHET